MTPLNEERIKRREWSFFKKVKRQGFNVTRMGTFKRSSRDSGFLHRMKLRLLRRGLKGWTGLCTLPRHI